MLLLSGLDVVVKFAYENRLRHVATVHQSSMIIISFNVKQER
jgi:hypothetical protein